MFMKKHSTTILHHVYTLSFIISLLNYLNSLNLLLYICFYLIILLFYKASFLSLGDNLLVLYIILIGTEIFDIKILTLSTCGGSKV